MPVVFACNEAYKRLEILHSNVWTGGEWWLAHLARLGLVLVKVNTNRSIGGGFSLGGFPHNIGVIAIWFNCLYYFILFLSKLHIIF